MLNDVSLYVRSPVKCRDPSVPVTNRQNRRPKRSPTLTSNPESFQKNLEAFTTSMFDDDEDNDQRNPRPSSSHTMIGRTLDEESLLSSIQPVITSQQQPRKTSHDSIRVRFADAAVNDASEFYQKDFPAHLQHQPQYGSEDLTHFASFLYDLPPKFRPPHNSMQLHQLKACSATELTKLVMKEHVELMRNKHLAHL